MVKNAHYLPSEPPLPLKRWKGEPKEGEVEGDKEEMAEEKEEGKARKRIKMTET